MTGWREDVLGLLYAMWMLGPIFHVGYLIAVPVRYARRARWTSITYARRSVKFHAWWGFLLSVPGLTISILGGLGNAWHWIGAFTLLATISCWVIAFEAGVGGTIRPAVAWLPLVTVVVSVNAYSALAGLPPEPLAGDVGAPLEVSDVLTIYAGNLMLITNFGLGLAAWLVVTICFALSVRRASRARELSTTPVHMASHPGFVWPTD